MSATLRFAPSPNGRLHLGHAYSALLNDALARRLGGTWLLRIENIDPVRSRPEWERGIYQDLRWLGFVWPEPAMRQSERLEAYRDAAGSLRARPLLYPCFCTRGDIARAVAAREASTGEPWPRDPDGGPLYPGTCRHRAPADIEAMLAAGTECAWRLDLGAALAAAPGPLRWTAFEPDGAERTVAADPARWGDAVLVRKDTPTSYHLAVVVDDAAQGITHVVRGQDLEAATDLHVLLQALLGLPTPRYHHHRLILDGDGAKLAKSAGSRSLAVLREAGVEPGDIRRALGFG